jgi:hypothetical protein
VKEKEKAQQREKDNALVAKAPREINKGFDKIG